MKDYNEVIEDNRKKWIELGLDEELFKTYLDRVQEEIRRVEFTPTSQQFDFLTTNDRITLVDSTAGSGKTTTIVLKSILDEVIWGIQAYNIVFLTFSKKSAEDMKSKRDYMMRRYYKSKNSARMSTIHSLCFSFLKTYYANPGGLHVFAKNRLIQDELTSYDAALADFAGDMGGMDMDYYDMVDDYSGDMGGGGGNQTSVVDIMSKFIKGNPDLEYIDNLSEMRNIMSCFAFQKERMLGNEDIVKERIFRSLECKSEHYFKLLEDVEAHKKLYEYFDFTDLQAKTLQILRENREFFYNDLTFQTVFKPVKLYVDEVQDMTPLQKQLIKELVEIPVSNGKQTSLVCIGDGDQTIYTWRGSETLEYKNFQDTFDPERNKSELKIFSKNHRCGELILNKAKQLVEHNTLRNPKNMTAGDHQGKFELVPYTNSKDMIKELVKEIKHQYQTEGVDSLSNTAVVYREHSQAMGLVTALLRLEIPFDMSGFKLPYKHWIFRNLMEMCESLIFDTRASSMECIYRFTPLNKKQAEVFKKEKTDYEGKTGKSVSWINYLEQRSKRGIKPVISDKVIRELKVLREGLMTDGASIRMVLDKLYSLYTLHNLGYVLDKLIYVERSEIESVEYFISSIVDGEDYNELVKKMDRWENYVDNYRKMRHGVKLMTLHSTKGLEFNKVMVIGVDSDYLPKESYAIELDPKNRKEYIEEERRLFYVGITRAINECIVYASITNPSIFLPEIDASIRLPRDERMESKQEPPTISTGNKPPIQRVSQGLERNPEDWLVEGLFKEELKCFISLIG